MRKKITEENEKVERDEEIGNLQEKPHPPKEEEKRRFVFRYGSQQREISIGETAYQKILTQLQTHKESPPISSVSKGGVPRLPTATPPKERLAPVPHLAKIRILRKYSLVKIGVIRPDKRFKILDPNHFADFIKTVDGNFLTSNHFEDPERARECLAISYTPLHEKCIDLASSEFEADILVNPFGEPNIPTRTWPAFGHAGGAWEILLIKKELDSDRYRKFSRPPLGTGGIPDLFCQESVAKVKDNGLTTSIAQIIHSEFLKTKLDKVLVVRENQEKEQYLVREHIDHYSPSMKIMDPGGTILYWKIQYRVEDPESKVNFSISCAYRELDLFPKLNLFRKIFRKMVSKSYQSKTVELEFWGYAWIDSESDKARYLWHPQCCPFRLPFLNLKSLKELQEAITQKVKEVSDKIEDVVQNFIEELRKVSSYFSDPENHPLIIKKFQFEGEWQEVGEKSLIISSSSIKERSIGIIKKD